MTFQHRSLAQLSFGLALTAALLASPEAVASPIFPDTVKQHLGLAAPAAEGCALCHTDAGGGPGKLTKPFGKTLQSRGLQAGDAGSLKTALDAITAEKKDSDGDCKIDVDELKAGTSPNEGAASCGAPAGSGDDDGPVYGCIGRVAGGRGSDGLPALAAALGVAVLLRRAMRRAIR